MPTIVELGLASGSTPCFPPAELKSPNGTTLAALINGPKSKIDAPIRTFNIPAPHAGHIRILELNCPATRNAISKTLLDCLAIEINKVKRQYDPVTCEEVKSKFLKDAEPMPTRALIVVSADDKSFCSGANLKERLLFSSAETLSFVNLLRSTLNDIENLPIPVIAAAAAPALGGGLELFLAAHLRVVGEEAVFAFPETRLAIVPGAGGMRRLAALVGIARARELVLLGRKVSGAVAWELGIADRLVEYSASDERSCKVRVLDEALRLAKEVCQGGPLATRMVMKAFRVLDEEAENAAYERVLKTADRNDALVAFVEKRQPVFYGR